MTGRPAAIIILPLLILLGIACGRDDEDLQGIAEDLTLDPGSGGRPSTVAAEISLDPNDTQKSLESAGRLDGYALVFPGTGSVVATRVDLWRDSRATRQGMEQMVGDFERLHGQRIGGLVIADVDRFRSRTSAISPEVFGFAPWKTVSRAIKLR